MKDHHRFSKIVQVNMVYRESGENTQIQQVYGCGEDYKQCESSSNAHICNQVMSEFYHPVKIHLTLLEYIMLKRIYDYGSFRHVSPLVGFFSPNVFCLCGTMIQSYRFVPSHSFLTLYVGLTAEEISDQRPLLIHQSLTCQLV